MFWSRRPKNFKEYQYHVLPGEVGKILLPVEFKVEMEEDSTLLAHPSGPERISLRFTTFSIVSNERQDAGEQIVAKNAHQQNAVYQQLNGKHISTYQKESEQDGIALLIQFWEVGIQNNIIILSATIIKKQRNHPLVKLTLDAIPKILESIQITKEHRVIEADGKTIHLTEQIVDPTPQTITPFGKDEDAWLTSNLTYARELGLKYGSGGELRPDELDCVFSRWMEEDPPKEDDECIANALGAAFGSWLVQEHDFKWVIVEDREFGSEYGVRHNLRETIAYPRASVQKRIEKGESDFFANIYLMILTQLQNMKESDQ